MAFDVIEAVNHIALLSLPLEYHQLLLSKKVAEDNDEEEKSESSESSEDDDEVSFEEVLPAFNLNLEFQEIEGLTKHFIAMAITNETESLNLSVGVFCAISAHYLPKDHPSIVKFALETLLHKYVKNHFYFITQSFFLASRRTKA